MELLHRDEYLRLNDQALLEHCDVQGTKGSGPGGQHRNKTLTGVRVALHPCNLEIRCTEDRSAHINKHLALRRLRLALALSIRQTPSPQPVHFPGTQGHVQAANAGYPSWIADVFDRLEVSSGELRPVAEIYGFSPSALFRILSEEKSVQQAFQQLRLRHGKAALKARP